MDSIDAQSFQPVLDALPTTAVMVLAAMVVAGAVLWLFGRGLARAACVASGLVLGALAGLMIGQALAEEGAMTLPLILGGGIAGALLAGLLFRVWMGVSGALLLALVAPAASIIWTGATPPPIGLGGDQQADQAADGSADASDGDPSRLETPIRAADAERHARQQAAARRATAARAGEATDADADATDMPGPIQALLATARGVYDDQAEGVRAWWDALEGPARGVLIVAAMIGAAAGLLLGLIAPNIAASGQSALVGSLLMFYPGRELLARLAPEQSGWLPQTPRATLVALGLITLVGILIQWTLSRRRADK